MKTIAWIVGCGAWVTAGCIYADDGLRHSAGPMMAGLTMFLLALSPEGNRAILPKRLVLLLASLAYGFSCFALGASLYDMFDLRRAFGIDVALASAWLMATASVAWVCRGRARTVRNSKLACKL